jgi:hypothetical protein
MWFNLIYFYNESEVIGCHYQFPNYLSHTKITGNKNGCHFQNN